MYIKWPDGLIIQQTLEHVVKQITSLLHLCLESVLHFDLHTFAQSAICGSVCMCVSVPLSNLSNVISKDGPSQIS